MKIFALCFAVAAVGTAALAQETLHPSKATLAYLENRGVTVEPPMALAKVKAIIKSLKADADDNHRLSPTQFAALSVTERFTYTMIHGEDATQNCDEMPAIVDSEKKIFGYFPGPFDDEYTWSEQQRAFLKSHRGSVSTLIRETMRKTGRTGANIKAAIMEINGIELIPDLVKLYTAQRKDHDILTLCLMLMNENKYQPFLATQTWTKLYGPESNYQGWIVANKANQDLTIQRAMAFYKSRVKQ